MRRIELLSEGHSRGRVREIYQEIEHEFAVPLVGSMFRALAAYSDVLDSVWSQFKSNVGTQVFIDFSSRIRSNADAMAADTFELDDLYAWMQGHECDKEDIRRIRYVLEMFHYLNPKLLLTAAAVDVAVNRIQSPNVSRRRPSPSRTQEPEFPTRAPQVMLDQAPDQVKEVYFDVLDLMGIPIVPDDFQALGNWQNFIRRTWNDLKPVMRSTTYLEESQRLSRMAVELAQELPHAVVIESPTDEIRMIAETFLSLYARQTISTAGIRWMVLEGERAARTIGRAAGERPAQEQ
ncbi:MAG: hypothetical protein HYX78_08045 [Armatimonadetes bacterium]|nr:hypothetical protein [Armatimonadota bacterium]